MKAGKNGSFPLLQPPSKRRKTALVILAFIVTLYIALNWIVQPPAARATISNEFQNDNIKIEVPPIWIKGVSVEVRVVVDESLPKGSECILNGEYLSEKRLPCETGEEVVFGNVRSDDTGSQWISVKAGGYTGSSSIRVIHGLLTILPPLVAIGLALIFRQVLAALWVSIWLGAFIIFNWQPFTAVARSIDHYIIGAMADPDDAAMLVFIIFMGGMIGMIARSGGIQGIVDLIARRATSEKSGQISTFLMGMFIFFDDYANTIIVGTTMRPITDRLKISREKLSYIVDSTAAPVASIFPISTWIGYEVGLINRALDSIGSTESGYMVFLESILYRFYPIFALALVIIVSLTGRDFGPMARAERRAQTEGKPLRDGAMPMSGVETRKLDPPENAPRRWYNAVIPLFAVIGVTFGGLWVNGMQSLGDAGYQEVVAQSGEYGAIWGKVFTLGQVYSAAAPNIVLAWASLAGCIITVFMVTTQRILSIGESMQAWLHGVESMVIAIVVLLLAWSLGQVCRDLHTAEYLTHSLAGVLSPRLLPVITFIIAAGISFATGTSYGTMAILIPLVIPIANRLGADAGFAPADLHLVLVGVVSSVLAGAVFGDHCSPISDTTIMSSMACSADHVDHVRTQLPYALLAGCVGMILGDIPAAYGLNPIVSILLGIGVMVVFLYFAGSRVEGTSTAGDEEKAKRSEE
jgi:Na+/H+ antiporter NhaC